jgi:thiamine pyrophosphokinase
MLAVIIADAPNVDLTPYLPLLTSADLLVGADGGARHFIHHRLLPQVVLGDLDSLEPRLIDQLQAQQVEIQRFPVAKNETDLELALLLALERGATRIRVLGALGGRPDMHLANHLLLAHPLLMPVDVALLDAGWQVRVISAQITLHGTPGQRVSLLPLGDVGGITTSGLRYPLHDEPLLLGPARGVSNEFISATARVTLRSGLLVVMNEGETEVG